ncbi:competence/damage-inducible protein A [Paenibacillus thermotolerans]|uniref:competence/damage-inducible protein A n=1 Tax=Paenibacillus thermotolerans TaxID=3027807 RepID=UPI002368DB0C|nr:MULTISPECIES: competence/damage-inducible protein A [unclassified Paenibacillus]
MKAEIIAVGTELLLGQIVNTNAQFLSQELAGLGIDVYFQTVVGDNETRVRQALTIAKERADLVLCTGGLGPTMDDITRDALAAQLGRGLVYDQEALRRIEAYFTERGIVMTENNRRQALMVEGADPLANDTGMAVGSALTHGGTHYILLPGPPRELKPMFTRYAVPWLRSVMGEKLPLYAHILKFAGIGESILEDRLIDLIKNQTDPTIAPYAKEGEVMLRLATKAASPEEAESKLSALRSRILERVGEYVYAEADVGLETAVLKALTANGQTLSLAESCTGGMIADTITGIPGSSAVLKGGVVCYTNAVKHGVLGVPMELLEGDGAPGAVSEQTALELAKGVRKLTGSDWGISVTGVAGPSESEGKPVGLVYIGVAYPDGNAQAFRHQFAGNREMVKVRATKTALFHLWRSIHLA